MDRQLQRGRWGDPRGLCTAAGRVRRAAEGRGGARSARRAGRRVGEGPRGRGCGVGCNAQSRALARGPPIRGRGAADNIGLDFRIPSSSRCPARRRPGRRERGGPHNPPANPPGLPTPLPRHGGAAGSASSPPKAAVAARGLCPELPPSLCASCPGPSPRSMTQRVTWEPPLHPRTRARRCLRRHFRAPEPGSRAPGQSQERGHRIGVAALRGLRLGFPALGW